MQGLKLWPSTRTNGITTVRGRAIQERWRVEDGGRQQAMSRQFLLMDEWWVTKDPLTFKGLGITKKSAKMRSRLSGLCMNTGLSPFQRFVSSHLCLALAINSLLFLHKIWCKTHIFIKIPSPGLWNYAEFASYICIFCMLGDEVFKFNWLNKKMIALLYLHL